MRYYCTLLLRSDKLDAPSSIFLADASEALEFEDNQSPDRVASAQRLRSVGFIRRNDLPRYSWHLDTSQVFESQESDPFVHVSWLFSRLKPGVMLAGAREQGIESSLAFYWGGSGTGGGPFISVKLSELLARHKIGLDIGFYHEAPGNGTNAA